MTTSAEQVRRLAAECLTRWTPAAQRDWFPIGQRPHLGCYGSGYNSWGVQTNQKFLGAMAVLASIDGPCRDLAAERALAALRFSLASHHTGDLACTDGTKWGRTWISPLGIERMMHGVDLLGERLDETDRRRLGEMLADEADHQLACPPHGGLWADKGANKPESNIWNGAVCVRAAWANPAHPHAGEWIEHACRCFINGISIPDDAGDATVIDGKPVAARHVGPNFFPHYALDHHGYLNVGYMVICLSNIAMLHYARRPVGAVAPASLYHHARDLWDVLCRMIFADGRLLRIGGDTRVRFCYCQEYLIPVLILAADLWGDTHAVTLLGGAADIIRREQDVADDGSFLSSRLSALRRQNPYYYTRLESDRAVVLSMALDWLGRRADWPQAPAETLERDLAGTWCELEHGAVLHRCPKRVASWSWRAAERPQGLCLPPGDGDLAEWKHNLAGGVRFTGETGRRELVRQTIATFDGGFVTSGEMSEGNAVSLPEGWSGTDSCRHHLAFAALGDGHCALRLEYATLAPRRVFIERCWGVGLNIPNDTFLKTPSRRYVGAGGAITLEPHLGEETTVGLDSRWVNVQDAIGLVAMGEAKWSILRPGQRSGGWSYGNILSDVLCLELRNEPFDALGPRAIVDNACLILSSASASQTQAAAEASRSGAASCTVIEGAGPCRACWSVGFDGRTYALAANFGSELARVRIELPQGTWTDACTGETWQPPAPLALAPGQARLMVAAGG